MLATKPEVGQTSQLMAPTWLKQRSELSRWDSVEAESLEADSVVSVESGVSVVGSVSGVSSIELSTSDVGVPGATGVISVVLGASGMAEAVGIELKRPETAKTNPSTRASIFLPKLSLSLIIFLTQLFMSYIIPQIRDIVNSFNIF